MSDLANAPQTGASEPVQSTPATSEAVSAPAESKATEQASEKAEKPLSSREAIRKAMETVNTRPANETEKAVAVLREGKGADERLASERTENAQKQETASEASERAKAGWETRRANAEKAAAEAKVAEAAPKPAEAPPVQPPAKPVEASKYEPPARLTAEAKAVWKDAPETLRAEVVRMHDEMTAGLTKHKESAEKYAPLADYERRSQEVYGQPLTETLKNYVELDEMLTTDPLAALERIVSGIKWTDDNGAEHNWTLKQMAEYIASQDQDTFVNENSELKRELASVRREMAELRNGLTQRQQMEVQQRTQTVEQQVQKFAADKPRFDELYEHMEVLLSSPKFQKSGDIIADLTKAYDMAERLNPAPTLSPPAPEIPAPDPTAQTRKGQASLAGAPGAGSNPARKPVPTSNRDAIKQALSAVGLASS